MWHPARVKAHMQKPSDFHAVRLGNTGVGCGACDTATRTNVGDVTNQDPSQLFRDLRQSRTPLKELERTSVCKFGVGASHVLGSNVAESNTLCSTLCCLSDDESVANLF